MTRAPIRGLAVGVSLLCALSACVLNEGSKAEGLPSAPAGPLRDEAIAFAADPTFELSRFKGNWVVRGSSASAQTLGAVDVTLPDGKVLFGELHSLCGDWGCEAWGDEGVGKTSTKGCVELTYVGGHVKDVCVLWVDADYQTAAIGDRKGSFAWVLARKPIGNDEKVAMAVNALKTNGFDTAQIKVGGHD